MKTHNLVVFSIIMEMPTILVTKKFFYWWTIAVNMFIHYLVRDPILTMNEETLQNF